MKLKILDLNRIWSKPATLFRPNYSWLYLYQDGKDIHHIKQKKIISNLFSKVILLEESDYVHWQLRFSKPLFFFFFRLVKFSHDQ